MLSELYLWYRPPELPAIRVMQVGWQLLHYDQKGVHLVITLH